MWFPVTRLRVAFRIRRWSPSGCTRRGQAAKLRASEAFEAGDLDAGNELLGESASQLRRASAFAMPEEHMLIEQELRSIEALGAQARVEGAGVRVEDDAGLVPPRESEAGASAGLVDLRWVWPSGTCAMATPPPLCGPPPVDAMARRQVSRSRELEGWSPQVVGSDGGISEPR